MSANTSHSTLISSERHIQRARALSRSPLPFAAGTACAALLFLLFSMPAPRQAACAPVTVQAAPRAAPPVISSPAEEIAERILNPTSEQLPAAIRIIERIQARHPELNGPRAVLSDLYRRQITQEADTSKKRQWREKLRRLPTTDRQTPGSAKP